MLRKIFAVIAGYVVFAISSVLLFKLTHQEPHADAPLGFKLITVVYGVGFSLLAGSVVRWISRANSFSLNYVLAVLIFGLALLSMLLSGGDHWTQWFAMLIFAPASFIGGRLVKNKLG